MSTQAIICPVLPTSDMDRDVLWYEKHCGFKLIGGDSMYAILRRDNLSIHLQWHANTEDDPLLGGSVIKIFVDDIDSWYEEFKMRKTITPEKLKRNTAWGTHEFGFYDLNSNAIFVVQNAQ